RGARAQRRRAHRDPRGTDVSDADGPAADRRTGRGPMKENEQVETVNVKRRVMVVDDEPGVRESLRMVLKDQYESVAVASGPEALEVVASTPVDVVLLDIVMPGMDGMQVLEELRTRLPQLPVVMLTATKTVKTAVGAMKLGAFDYVTKPFDVDELRLILEKATERAALVREVEELRTEVGRRYQLENIVGRSAK